MQKIVFSGHLVSPHQADIRAAWDKESLEVVVDLRNVVRVGYNIIASWLEDIIFMRRQDGLNIVFYDPKSHLEIGLTNSGLNVHGLYFSEWEFISLYFQKQAVQITESLIQDVTVLEIIGGAYAGGYRQLNPRIAEVSRRPGARVLLNLSNLPVIHGTTIGEILRGAALLRSSDGDIGLFGASEQVMEELRLANVGDSIRIYTDEAEALSNFCLA